MDKQTQNWKLIDAIKTGNLGEVEQLLYNNLVNPNYQDENGQSLLHWAAYYGHEHIIKELLKPVGCFKKPRVDISIKNNTGLTPFLIAAKHGWNKIIDILISSGAKIDEVSFNGTTAIKLAASNGKNATIDHLVACYKCDLNRKCNYNLSILFTAVVYGQNSTIDHLIYVHKCNIDETDHNGVTLLLCAAALAPISTVDHLIKIHQCKLSDKTKSNETVLHMAANYKNNDVLDHIIKTYGCDLNDKTKSGRTALHIASYHGYASTVSLLLSNGANVHSLSLTGNTPLLDAIEQHQIDPIFIIVDYIKYTRDGNLETVLDAAIEFAMNQWNIEKRQEAENILSVKKEESKKNAGDTRRIITLLHDIQDRWKHDPIRYTLGQYINFESIQIITDYLR